MAITFCGQQLHGYGLGQPIGIFHAVLLGDFGGGEFLRAAAAGAGFVVALTGDIMRMPGLPKEPAALRIDVSPDGTISGLS